MGSNTHSQTSTDPAPDALIPEKIPGSITEENGLTGVSEEARQAVQIEPVEETGAQALAICEDNNKTGPTPVKVPNKNSWGGRVVTITARVLMALAAVFTVLIMVLTVGPRFLPYQVCSVLSGSMVPTLPVGSVVILTQTEGSQLKVGDIITFNYPNRPDQLVTHRIYEVKQGPGGPAFVTKGDANNVPDSWVVSGSGTGWREVFTIPYLGYILGALGSPLLRLLILGIPAFLLGILLLVEIWSPKPRLVAGT